MHTSECSVIKELPKTVNLASTKERKQLDELGKKIASQENLHYEGYVAFTDAPYSLDQAKATLFFD
ncbi:MAG: hypothetical protein KKA31_04295 [Candidatus Margulisbacteria bacterium]|nr:hypothetical protein [Candidatus Margulisiibacteriota bacterium]